jgi:phosphoglycerate dehydrogenase-like enzyme
MRNIIVSLILTAAWSFGGASAATTLEQEKERLSAEAVQLMIAELGLRASEIPSRELPGWGKVTKIVARYPSERIAELQTLAPRAEVVVAESAEEAAAALPGAQVLLGFCSEQVLAGADSLHWVQVYSSGVERCVSLPAMQQGDRLLTNGQRIASPALAESAIALMMALVRGLDVYYANQLQGEWRRNAGMERNEFMELDGRTILVVGLGGIGTQVARKAHGLGMRVLATRGSRREGPDYVEYVGLADETVALAAQADVVVNTVPLTDRTRGMFDAAFFEAMKPTAFYISVGRGATTVTDDLLAALQNGQLAGAGLDVTDPEPLPEGHPLWTAPRVIITPHVGGRSDRGRERLYLLVRENLRRYVAGEPMLSVVDIERGY